MIKDVLIGITSYLNHFRNLSKFGLWKFTFMPSLLGLLFLIGLGFSSLTLGDDIGDWMVSWYKWEFGSALVAKLSHWIGGLLIAVLGLLLAKYVVILIASPFMSPMSQKIDQNITGSHDQLNSGGILETARGFSRGLRITFRNIFKEIFFTLLLLLLGLIIPIISPFTTILIFLIQSYYAGFGNMDYTLERYYGVKDASKFVKRNKGLALGNGMVFMLLLMLGIGFLIAPPLATNAVTPEVLKRLN